MAQKTILIIEDNAEFRVLLKQIVSDAGYAVIVAENGEAGFHQARAHRPDMILCDIQMPKMNGYEVTEAVRKDPAIGRTPMIIISVQSKMEEVVKGLKLGADDYMTKPFDPEEVTARITALFRQVQQRGGA